MKANWQYYASRLTRSTYSVVSIDGLKAGMLRPAWRCHQKQGDSDIFNIMGHPKSVTPYSLRCLDGFLATAGELRPITYQDLRHLKPRG